MKVTQPVINKFHGIFKNNLHHHYRICFDRCLNTSWHTPLSNISMDTFYMTYLRMLPLFYDHKYYFLT